VTRAAKCVRWPLQYLVTVARRNAAKDGREWIVAAGGYTMGVCRQGEQVTGDKVLFSTAEEGAP
jgi:hypothetical protein